MKWRERHGATIEGAILVMMVVALCFVFLGLIAIRAYGASCLTADVPPQAVVGVMDGDTFKVFSLMPPGYVKIRVQGVDTPERKEARYDEARQFTGDWLAKGTFQLSTCGKPTLDRIVGVVSRDGQTLANALKQAGLVKKGIMP